MSKLTKQIDIIRLKDDAGWSKEEILRVMNIESQNPDKLFDYYANPNRGKGILPKLKYQHLEKHLVKYPRYRHDGTQIKAEEYLIREEEA